MVQAGEGIEPRLRFLDPLTWRHVLLASLAGALVVGAVVFAFLPRRYTAATTILISSRPDIMTLLSAGAAAAGTGLPSSMPLASILTGGPVDRMQTILNSRTVREQLAKKYGLSKRLRLPEDKVLTYMHRITGIEVNKNVDMTVSVTLSGPSRVAELLGLQHPYSTEEAKQLCAAMANDYINLLDQQMASSNAGAAHASRVFMEKRTQEVQANLANIEDRLQELQATRKLLDPQQAIGQILDVTKTTAQAYAQARAEAEGAAQGLRAAQQALSTQQAMRISQEVAARNPLIEELEKKLAELQLSYMAETAGGKSASHPDVVVIRSQMDELKEQLARIQREVRNQLARTSNPVYDTLMGKVADLTVAERGAAARARWLSAELEKSRRALADLPPVLRQYAELMRQRVIQEQLLATLTTQLELASIEERRENSGQFEVLDRAVPPLRKSGPSSLRAAVLAFTLLCFLQVIALAYRRGLLFGEKPHLPQEPPYGQ